MTRERGFIRNCYRNDGNQGIWHKKREPIFRLIPFVLKRRLPTLPLLRSTIGVTRLNFSVRNGKRWIPRAIATLMPFYLLSLTGQPPEFLQNRLFTEKLSNPSQEAKVSGY